MPLEMILTDAHHRHEYYEPREVSVVGQALAPAVQNDMEILESSSTKPAPGSTPSITMHTSDDRVYMRRFFSSRPQNVCSSEYKVAGYQRAYRSDPRAAGTPEEAFFNFERDALLL